MAKKLRYDSSPVVKQKWNLKGSAQEIRENMSGAHIELFSNRELFLEGCNGVIEYSDTYLKLKLKHGMLIVVGNGLDITAFEDKKITIRGNINSLEFCV